MSDPGKSATGRSRGRGRARGKKDQPPQQQAAPPGPQAPPAEPVQAQGGARARDPGLPPPQAGYLGGQQQFRPPYQGGSQQGPPPQASGPRGPSFHPPPASAQAAAEQARNVSAVPTGRASHRGGARGEPRPGTDALCRKMEALELAPGDKIQPLQKPRKIGDLYIEPYTRPAYVKDNKSGEVGQPIALKSNCFELVMAPSYMLYQYSVDFSPEVANKRMRIGLLLDHKNILGNVNAFDGVQLFLPRRLEKKVTEVNSTKRDGQGVRITITLRAEVAPNSDTALQVFNIIFKRVLGMIGCQQIQRHYYNPDLAVKIEKHRMEVWPGYITSIAKFEQKVMLMSDISHKVLRSETVVSLLEQLWNRDTQTYQENVKKKLVGQIVLTRYNNKTYRIDDVDFSQNPNSKFKTTSRKFQPNAAAGGGEPQEQEISYNEYYKTQHNIEIQNQHQPLLVSRPKKADIRRGQEGNYFLIPSLCSLTGISDEMFTDFTVMKDLAVHTRVGPDGRYRNLLKFINKINITEKAVEELKGWNLEFSKDLVQIRGRQLPAEKIFQGHAQYSYDPKKADWDRELRGKQLHQAMTLGNWLFLYAGKRDEGNAQNFVQALMRVGKGMGFNINRPEQVQVESPNTNAFMRALRERLRPDTQMVVCMLPTSKKDLYDNIKKTCCVEKPVPSQCLLGKTVSRQDRVMSVATKIAIQMNMKLGGQAWTVEIPLKETMICGIDTYHDSSKKGRSVSSLVCSMNKAATQYFSKVTFQESHMELAQGLTVNMVASLKQFHQNNGYLPQRIFIYRDGVGDGQVDVVFNHELTQIWKAFKQIGHDYNPKVGVIIVQKRINTRLFSSGQGAANPPPGVVVDNVVTRQELFDFFLVSQSVRQGSVTPTHYNVIYDSMGLKPDYYQRITYKMCHLYFNWPGTIRVPAPCQYAHKLAFLCGQSLHTQPAHELSQKLFFL